MRIQIDSRRTTKTFSLALCAFLVLLMNTVYGGQPKELQERLQNVYKNAGEAVVGVTSKMMIPTMFNREIPQEGSGSGFVYDDKGHVVTSHHIVGNASEIMVSLDDEEMYEAELVGSDASSDLAVLKVDEAELPAPIEMGDSNGLEVGQFVAAIGNPFGLRRTLNFGVISALGRIVRSPNGRFISEVIQTDAPINMGNSGGPLLDMDGKLIGVNTMILSPSGASSGVGFSVSADTVDKVCPVLIEEGKFPHPWLGIQAVSLSKGMVKMFQKAGVEIPTEKGAMVVNVFSGSPGAKAGLTAGEQYLQLGMLQMPVGGDIIVAIDGNPIESYKDLVLYLETESEIGDTVEVEFMRGDEKMTEEVTLEERPTRVKVQPPSNQPQQRKGQLQ